MKMMFDTFKPYLCLVICIIISALTVMFSPTLSDGSAGILQDSFILSFLGMFAGLEVACITFMFANIEKIRDSIHKSKCIKSEYNIDKSIINIINELKEDTLSTVLCLVFCFIIILFRDVDIPKMSFNVSFISKQQIVSVIEVTLILITLFAIKDIMQSLFNLNRILLFIQTKVNKNENIENKN